MRILVVNVHFNPDSFGGATVVAEQTALRLQQRGHEVAVLTTMSEAGRQKDELARWDVGGLPVVGVAVGDKDPVTIGYSYPPLVPRFRQVLEVFRPDVIHFHSIQFMGVEQVEEAQALGVPTVLSLHDAWWLCERQFMIRPSKRWCGQTAIDPRVCSTCAHDRIEHEARQQRSRQILNASAKVLVPSPYWRDLMVASGVDAARVALNSNGVLHPRSGWLRPPAEGPLRFGYVGGLNAIKGYHTIIEAFTATKRSDYELQVVDSTLNLGFASLQRADFPVAGLVKLIPGYTQDSMDAFFGGIDVLLFPSQAPESYGLTVREALLRGVWPVVSNLGGVANAVEDGVNGSLIEVDGTAAPLTRAVQSLLDQVDLVRADRPIPLVPTFDDQTEDLERHLTAALGG